MAVLDFVACVPRDVAPSTPRSRAPGAWRHPRGLCLGGATADDLAVRARRNVRDGPAGAWPSTRPALAIPCHGNHPGQRSRFPRRRPLGARRDDEKNGRPHVNLCGPGSMATTSSSPRSSTPSAPPAFGVTPTSPCVPGQGIRRQRALPVPRDRRSGGVTDGGALEVINHVRRGTSVREPRIPTERCRQVRRSGSRSTRSTGKTPGTNAGPDRSSSERPRSLVELPLFLVTGELIAKSGRAGVPPRRLTEQRPGEFSDSILGLFACWAVWRWTSFSNHRKPAVPRTPPATCRR